MNNPQTTPPQRARPLTDAPADARRASELLRTPGALRQLSEAEADCVAAQMRLVVFHQGSTLFHEGDDTRTGYLLLLLDGEVSVETAAGGHTPLPISVLGAGSVIGEMALLDGSPRSATCVALAPVRAAGLSRQGLDQLIESQPKVAVKLLASLGSHIAERLRAMNEQLQMVSRLNGDLQAELTQLRNKASR
jgi:CRP/FNR family transcriptional regulator, cyclic AMP receptor protein